MTPEFDVLIIGSGPAGVSAAFPLLKAGLKVLMVDGGKQQDVAPPTDFFLTERRREDQWRWFVGADFYASKKMETVSPKLRVPTHEQVFKDFLESTGIKTKNFVAIGSLATGGLSNAWGCGVARLNSKELADFPFSASDIVSSYETVTRRMGISGGGDDDLAAYFGVDEWSQPPIKMDAVHEEMLARYKKSKSELQKTGFRVGRSRVAALSQPLGNRLACDLSGNCLWGCHRQSLYTSTQDLGALRLFPNFTFNAGFTVDRLLQKSGFGEAEGTKNQTRSTVTARRVLLAAGSLASTRLALRTIGFAEKTRVDSCPTAAFLLWIPKMLGTPRKDVFGLGQLSYQLEISDAVTAFGSTFSTTGIPVSEFVRQLPLGRRQGVKMMRHILSSCVVGNLFLPGHLSTSTAKLNASGGLDIDGGFREDVPDLLKTAARKLRKSYSKLGAFMLPMSFTAGLPGGDIHYSGTIPMRKNPKRGETGVHGELFGTESMHIVDGASLPRLTEKSHTLTIMANADRIGRFLATELTGGK